jgi:hypothetical protein
MGNDDNWRKVHEFLVDHFRSQKPFKQEDLFAVTTWTGQSPKTYWSKQIRQFVAELGNDKYRVTQAFRRVVSWDRFHRHASQMRSMVSEYTSLTYENVLIYEFFMPLTNEEHLRSSLDALFYKETIRQRLLSVEVDKLRVHFPKQDNEDLEGYLGRTAEWISTKFGGYSISHVSGRFKAGALSTFAEAALMQADGGRYLIDETTAIVRFIFPCGKPFERKPPLSPSHFEDVGSEAAQDAGAADDASNIRWFFGVLFVQSIVEVVNGEAEIWMVESGMRHRLHIWRVES